jgi:myo-inositol catabolism protein IolH
MKIALDPYMLRSVPLVELPGVVAELGYQHIELSPREDFIPFFLHPRADKHTIAGFKKALAGAGVSVATVLPLYRWSGPDEDERQAAVRYWKRAIQVTVDLGCRVMNSEFNGRPEAAAASEAQFWRSLEELLPIFEREGLQLRLEPHPDDFIEDGRAAIQMIRGIDNDLVSFLYCAPHTFHQGGDMEGIMRDAGPLLTHLHIADSFDHRASGGCATSSTRRARRRGCTSTWTSGRARSTGSCSSGRWPTSSSTASPPSACSPGRSGPASRQPTTSSRSSSTSPSTAARREVRR